MASEINVDLPPRFEFTKTEPKDKEEELVDYLRRLSRAVEENIKKTFIRTAETIDSPTADNLPKLDEDGELVDSGISVSTDGTLAGDSDLLLPTQKAVKTYVDAINSVPAGMIAMWHGTLATIPDGWYLCDGDNDTPDLIAVFVRGVATAATNPGGTGGADTHTHSDGSYAVASHTHAVSGTSANNTATKCQDEGGSCSHTSPETYHNHAISFTSGAASPDVTGTSGSGSTLPAYYAVAFIMKS